MVPASGVPIWLAAAVMVLLIALATLFGGFLYSARHTKFQVGVDGLGVSGTLYGRQISLQSFLLKEAKVLDLAQDETHWLKWRTNGLGLPGYQAGWFRLGNGEKALAFITDARHVAYLPTTDGYSVLLSVAEPEELLEALRQAAAEK